MATKTLAWKLKKARAKNKLSMSEVARKSQELKGDRRGRITQGYISRLEAGTEANPSYLKIVCLCRIYKMDPAELFD